MYSALAFYAHFLPLSKKCLPSLALKKVQDGYQGKNWALFRLYRTYLLTGKWHIIFTPQ